VLPGENTSFSVFFLPQSTGARNHTLTLTTSQGDIGYTVKTAVVPHPFGLRPILRARLPVGVSFQQSISVFNPGPRSLQVSFLFLFNFVFRRCCCLCFLWLFFFFLSFENHLQYAVC
jgi:hypothetical protein